MPNSAKTKFDLTLLLAHNLNMAYAICNIKIAMGTWYIIPLISEILGQYHLNN